MPKPNAGDVAHALTKAGLSAFPIIGGPVADFFELVFIPPLSKRREAWFLSLIERLRILEKKVAGFNIKALSSNGQFISAVMNATSTAIRTHQEEKLAALRNAVLNVALKSGLDDELQQTFINYIDDLTPSHLRVLSFYSDPESWLKTNPPKEVPEGWTDYEDASLIAFPELRDSGILGQIITDLKNRGLLDAPNLLHTNYGRIGYYSTSLGKNFLKSVTSPIEE
jgi:hypothetical protein